MKKFHYKLHLIQFSTLLWLLFGVASATFGAGNQKWHSEGQTLTLEIQAILVNNDLCKSIEDCTKKELVFFNPTSSGLEISVYGVKNRELIAAIVGKGASHIVSPGITKIKIRFFQNSKKTEIIKNGIFVDTSFVTFNIEGNYGKH
jgi:hypothetical protein